VRWKSKSKSKSKGKGNTIGDPAGPAKRAKTSAMAASASEGPRIGTHDGMFHCDEAMAVAMLRRLPAYKDAKVTRTRVPEELEKCDVVVDVGGVYDPSTLKFDHHQREFNDALHPEGGRFGRTRLSSAGLVYKHFGKKSIASELEALGVAKLSDEDLDKVYLRVYENLVETLDAQDNGVPQFDGPARWTVSTDLGARVARLNKPWNVEWEHPDFPSPDVQFQKAVTLVSGEFSHAVKAAALHWLPARSLVEEAVGKRKSVHPSGKIVELTKYCPWADHLHDIERDMGIEGQLLYVIYSDPNSIFRVQCVPKDKGSFVSRLPLAEAWQGLRDKALDKVTGIEGGIFVHANGFIAGHNTRAGVISLATSTMAMAGQS